jgi:hypothetical protein
MKPKLHAWETLLPSMTWYRQDRQEYLYCGSKGILAEDAEDEHLCLSPRQNSVQTRVPVTDPRPTQQSLLTKQKQKVIWFLVILTRKLTFRANGHQHFCSSLIILFFIQLHHPMTITPMHRTAAKKQSLLQNPLQNGLLPRLQWMQLLQTTQTKNKNSLTAAWH